MANGTIHTFGTLKVNGTTYAKPSNPVKNGDCISYNGTLISIENTESSGVGFVGKLKCCGIDFWKRSDY